jgi:iron-sulfur cluster assembly protein
MNPSQSTNTTDRGIELSDLAKVKIRDLLKSKDISEKGGLRVGIQGGGCSGFEYVCNVNRKANNDDTVFFKGTDHQVFIDAKSMFFLTGLVIDYSEALTGAGFVFKNPNATGTCGCGISFAI